MIQATLLTQEEVSQAQQVAGISLANLRAHIIKSYGAAHRSIQGQTINYYSGSGTLVGNTVLTVTIAGTNYYVPANYVGISTT